MHRILIAVDGSKQADKAIEVGLQIASAQQAEVTFLHVLVPPGTSEYNLILHRASAQAEEAGVPSKRELVAGRSISRSIVDYADEIKASLIVVGTRGLGPVTGALLGSASKGVLKRTERPTLVVHAAHPKNAAASTKPQNPVFEATVGR